MSDQPLATERVFCYYCKLEIFSSFEKILGYHKKCSSAVKALNNSRVSKFRNFVLSVRSRKTSFLGFRFHTMAMLLTCLAFPLFFVGFYVSDVLDRFFKIIIFHKGEFVVFNAFPIIGTLQDNYLFRFLNITAFLGYFALVRWLDDSDLFFWISFKRALLYITTVIWSFITIVSDLQIIIHFSEVLNYFSVFLASSHSVLDQVKFLLLMVCFSPLNLVIEWLLLRQFSWFTLENIKTFMLYIPRVVFWHVVAFYSFFVFGATIILFTKGITNYWYYLYYNISIHLSDPIALFFTIIMFPPQGILLDYLLIRSAMPEESRFRRFESSIINHSKNVIRYLKRNPEHKEGL